MRNKTRIIIIIIAFFIQPLLSAMLPTWLVPDLDFCILVIFATIYDKEELVIPTSLILGLALLSDIYHSQYAGASVIAMVLVLGIILRIRKMGNIENLLFVLIIAGVSTIAYNFAYWVIYALMSSPYSFLYMLKQLPRSGIINIVIITAVLFAISKDVISKRRDKYFR